MPVVEETISGLSFDTFNVVSSDSKSPFVPNISAPLLVIPVVLPLTVPPVIVTFFVLYIPITLLVTVPDVIFIVPEFSIPYPLVHVFLFIVI